jgi:hypothetical protein
MSVNTLNNTRIRRIRQRVRRFRAKAQGNFGIARLLVYAYLGRVDQVWIGDSHAVHMLSPTMITALRRMPDGRWVMHLGPRLMYSIAHNDFPPAALRMFRLARYAPGAKDIVWGFSIGGLDTRNQLAPRMSDPEAALSFVPLYLKRVQQAATSAGARRALVLIPPPEADVTAEQIGFPIVGTLTERMAATRAMRDALIKAAGELPDDGASISFVDVTAAFSDERGAMRDDMTFDHIHADEEGRDIFRAQVDEILRSTAEQNDRSSRG